MLLEITIIAMLGLYYLTEAIVYFYRRKIKNRVALYGPDKQYQPSDYDKELIEKSKEIVKKQFPEGIDTTMPKLSIEQRMEKLKKITEDVAELFEVEITAIEFLSNKELSPNTLGHYNINTGKIAFNLDILNCADLELLHMIIGTPIHECFHALQFKACSDESYTKYEDERVLKWAVNFMNYISADMDEYGYYYQIVEWDARNLAEDVIEDL